MTSLCNSRYDAIIHMMSAAKDAEEHYARDIPGQPRHQTLDESRHIDNVLRQAWIDNH